MATNYLDLDDLNDAANALGVYIEEVGEAASKMIDAAQDCHDNLGQDVITARAVERVNECAQHLQRTIDEAESLRQRILNKAQDIQDLNGALD